MATKPKNSKAATTKENQGEEHPEPAHDADDESTESAPEEVAEAAVIPPSDPAKETLELAGDDESAGSEVGIDKSVPGALFAHEIADPPPTDPLPRTRSTTGLVFGGLIAGAIGFLAATFLPNGWINQNADVEAELLATTDAQSVRIDELTDQIELLRAEISEVGGTDLDPLSGKVSDLGGRLEALATGNDRIAQRLDDVTARLEALEARPIVSVPDGSNAMAAQLDAFRSELDTVTEAARIEIEEAKARAAEIEAEAAAVAADAQRRAALADIGAALESGAPFADSISRLDAVPGDLVAVADTGVPTHASLQTRFPDLARSALSMAQDAPEAAGTGERLASFLRRQTNARSLSARDGDDVDAILSRAEARLQEGKLAEVLGELETLPDAPRSVFASWMSLAESRVGAVSAFAAISEVLN